MREKAEVQEDRLFEKREDKRGESKEIWKAGEGNDGEKRIEKAG